MKDGLSPTLLLTRIGINTGNMVAGNMDTGNKMNYTIMGNATPQEKQLTAIFHQALDYYNKHSWKEAAQGFKESLTIENGGPSTKYLAHCKTFLTAPPPDTWDGVNNLTKK